MPPPVPPEPAEWYFIESGRSAGPVTWTQLRERAISGQLLARDMVWKDGMATWATADTINDLVPKQTIAPPPLPPSGLGTASPLPTESTPPLQVRFVDNGDNTISDLKHGLMWIKDLRLVPGFEDVGELIEMDWLTAKEKCEQLHYLGYRDWRLCRLPEIKSITDHCSQDKPKDAVAIQLLRLWHGSRDSGIFDYWTASEAKYETGCFWRFRLWSDQTISPATVNIGSTCKAFALPVRDLSLSDVPTTTDTRIRTNEALAYLNRGRKKQEKGSLDEAISDFCQAIRLDPANAHHHTWLAEAYAKKGMLNEYLAEYKEAARLDNCAFRDLVGSTRRG